MRADNDQRAPGLPPCGAVPRCFPPRAGADACHAGVVRLVQLVPWIRVPACNEAGCSGYSNTGSISVAFPPATPSITFSVKYQWKVGTLTKIRCEVRWTAPACATSYDLMVPGSGLVQYSGPLTSINKEGANYCAPSHVVRACSAAGCSAYSSPPYTQGFQDLGNPSELAAPVDALEAQSQGEGE